MSIIDLGSFEYPVNNIDFLKERLFCMSQHNWIEIMEHRGDYFKSIFQDVDKLLKFVLRNYTNIFNKSLIFTNP